MAGIEAIAVIPYIAASTNVVGQDKGGGTVVTLTAAETVDIPAGANVNLEGVAYDTPKSANTKIGVQISGIAKCVAAGAITPGAAVQAAATLGRVQSKAVVDGASINYLLGWAITGATNAGDIVYVRLAQQAIPLT